MTEQEQPDPSDDPHIESLIKFAGARTDLPTQTRQRLEHDFRLQLDAVRRKRQLGRRVSMAIAASVMLVAIALNVDTDNQRFPEIAGTIERSVGDSQLTDPHSGRIDAVDGSAVSVGAILETGATGRLMFLLAGDVGNVRLDHDTRLRINSAEQMELMSGNLYIDIQRGRSTGSLTIQTKFADISHIGTQFLVRTGDGNTQVSVREGSIKISTPTDQIVSEATHEQAIFRRIDAASIGREETIARFGGNWDWVQAIAPDFDTHNRPLIDFLQWVSRETGRPLRFQSEAVQRRAATTRLVGTLQDFSPLDALVAHLSTTDFVWQQGADDVILISMASDH